MAGSAAAHPLPPGAAVGAVVGGVAGVVVGQGQAFKSVADLLGAAKAMPWVGVGVTLIILGWHFYRAKQAKPEITLMLTALFIGAIFDQSMLTLHLIEYQAHGWGMWLWNNSLVPVWILALWLAFASTLNVSLAWMHDRYLIAMLFGLAGGPLAYFAAEKLGAVTVSSTNAYIALAIGWGVITPLLVRIAKRHNGFTAKVTS